MRTNKNTDLTELQKSIRRDNIQLVKHHKQMIDDLLKNKYKKKLNFRHKFFEIYDHFINEENILQFYHKGLELFISALLSNRLDEITDIIPQNESND